MGELEDIAIQKHECGKGDLADVIVSDMIKDNTVEPIVKACFEI